MPGAADFEQLKQWTGRVETRSDTITVAPLVSLAALLDRDEPAPRAGDPAPSLAHEVSGDHGIVYRGEAAGAANPLPAPAGERWSREIRPDPLLLFRYSAVTFNGHRIRYDHPYVTKVEGEDAGTARLWTRDAEGAVTMEATACW